MTPKSRGGIGIKRGSRATSAYDSSLGRALEMEPHRLPGRHLDATLRCNAEMQRNDACSPLLTHGKATLVSSYISGVCLSRFGPRLRALTFPGVLLSVAARD